MKAKMNSAEDTGHGASLALEQVKERFAQWRLGRKPGERITHALWAAAVGLVEQHGLQRTAQALGVNGDQLEKRVARSAAPAHTAKAPHQFVELFAQSAPSAAPASPCIIEMQNVRGAKMRVELGSIAGLDGLVNAFWGAQ